MNKNERTLYQDLPTGKFHSGVLTSYAFDLSYFDNQILNLLRSKRICSLNILVDQQQLYSSINFQLGALRKIGKEYAVTGLTTKGAFHPKLNYFIGDDSALLLFGSGNITVPGHGKNHEIFSGFQINKEDSSQLPFLQEAWEYISSHFKKIGGYTNKRILEEILQNCLFKLNEKTAHHVFRKLDDNTDAALLYNEKDNSIYNQLKKLLPKDITTITVASPFFDEDGEVLLALLELFPSAIVNVLLQGGCKMPPNKLKKNSRIYFYDFNLTTRGKNNSFGKFIYQRNLHAKIFHFAADRMEFVMIGSANATIAALGSNLTKPLNEEFCSLYRSATRNFLKELQISEKCLLQTAVSEMEREANTFTSNASPAINLSAIDATEENITLYLADCKKSLNVDLIGYNKENEPTTLANLHIDNTLNNIKVTTSGLNSIVYCNLIDIDGNVVSNSQYVNHIIDLSSTNPSKENRELNKMLAKIEGGNYNGIEIIEFINNLICDVIYNDDQRENTTGHANYKPEQKDKIAHYDPEYDTDKESDNIFFPGRTMCSRLIEYMEFAISNKAHNINEILKGEEDEADAVESNNRETYVRQNIKIDTNELDNIIDRVHHVFVRYNELINLRLKEFQTNPKQALNTQDIEYLAATTFAALDFCVFNTSVFNFYNSKTINEDRDYLLPYLSDIVMKDIPCIVNNFTYFAIRTHCKQIDDNMLLYANKAMRFIILGLHAAISRMTEKDYNYYMPKIELVLINLFDIFGVPNLDAIEDTIDQINLVYEKGISKSDIRCLIDKCTNIKVDNNNYKRWQGYGITKSNKNAQECIKLQELRCI